jgi:hypothetical protein
MSSTFEQAKAALDLAFRDDIRKGYHLLNGLESTADLLIAVNAIYSKAELPEFKFSGNPAKQEIARRIEAIMGIIDTAPEPDNVAGPEYERGLAAAIAAGNAIPIPVPATAAGPAAIGPELWQPSTPIEAAGFAAARASRAIASGRRPGMSLREAEAAAEAILRADREQAHLYPARVGCTYVGLRIALFAVNNNESILASYETSVDPCKQQIFKVLTGLMRR